MTESTAHCVWVREISAYYMTESMRFCCLGFVGLSALYNRIDALVFDRSIHIILHQYPNVWDRLVSMEKRLYRASCDEVNSQDWLIAAQSILH